MSNLSTEFLYKDMGSASLGKGWLGSISHSDITSAVLLDVKQEINPKAFIFTLAHSFFIAA